MTLPMTLTEKIIARAAGVSEVCPGQEVWAIADRLIMNDSSGPRRIAALIEQLGGVQDHSRVVLVSDHFVPAANVRHAKILATTRSWAREQGIAAFHEYRGILHNLVLEDRLVEPGMLLVGADSHTTTAGAMGAVAVAVGSTELATVLATGQVWLRVPETVRFDLDGELAPWIDVRDITMRILGDMSSDFALYRAIEYGGSQVSRMALQDRLVLSNQGIEMGAKNAVVIPDATLEREIADRGESGAPALQPDDDARYCARHHYDLGELVPLVAAPPSPDNVAPAASFENVSIDMAWLGSCAGGRHADLRAAAQVVRGRRAAVPFLITPATQAIYHACLSDGTLETLVAAGAMVLPPGCGACAGIHAGVQGPGERVMATATRNFSGRMGSRQAEVFLGSPYTVAASAVAGRVIDPRDVVGEHDRGGRLRRSRTGYGPPVDDSRPGAAAATAPLTGAAEASHLRGRAWVFGPGITTDDILPGQYLERSNDEVAAFVMAGRDPELAGKIQPGDFLVAGANFGAGSGRESAPYAIRNAGIAGIIAPSFGRVFFRNAINIGLTPVIVDHIDGIETGDVLTVDIEQRTVISERTGEVREIRNLTGISRDILRAGGIVPYTLARQQSAGK